MKLVHTRLPKVVAMALVAVVFTAVGSVAKARDVHWSIGVHAAPGLTVGVGSAPPVYYAPAPVYYAPAPVYVAPPPVYYVRPAPVYYGPVRYYGGPPHKKWRGHRHHRHHH